MRGRLAHVSGVIRRELGNRPFVRSVGVLAGGTAAGQLVSVLAMLVLTRIYTAVQFGQLQYYSTTLLVLISIAALRYETAILLPEDDAEAAGVLCAAILSSIVVVAVVSIGLWVSRDSYLFRGERAALRPFILVLPVSAFGASTYQTLSYWAVRKNEFARIAKTRVAQAVAQSSGQLALGVAGLGVVGLIVGDVMGRVTGSFELLRAAWNKSGEVFRALQWKDVKRAAHRYRHFPLVSSWSALVNSAGLTLPPLLLGGYYGARTLGWFGLMDRALALPAMMVGQAISQVYMSRAARLATTDPSALRSLHLSSIRRLAIFGLVPYGTILVAGPQLFSLVFGASWREAGTYAQMLAVVQLAGFVSWPLTPTLNILERQAWQFAWDVSRLALAAAAVVGAHALGWPARGAVAAYGAALLLGYLAHLVASQAAIIIRQRAFSGRGEESAPSRGSVEPGLL
jgi:O-antigen/teichoic acid export membrane protein